MSGYPTIGSEVGELVAIKQTQYGNSFGNAGKVMALLYPNGISLEQMDDALVVVRIIDKLYRIANGSQGDESPYKDICGYAILAIGRTMPDEIPTNTYTY